MASCFVLQVRTSPKFSASRRWRVAPFPPRRRAEALVLLLRTGTFPQSAAATTGYLYRIT